MTYTPPLETPRGKVHSSRATAMFDCAKGHVATKESVLYLDEAAGREFIIGPSLSRDSDRPSPAPSPT